MTTFEKLSLESGKKWLSETLPKFTQKEITFFHKLFGEIDSIILEEMPKAIGICERTLKEKAT